MDKSFARTPPAAGAGDPGLIIVPPVLDAAIVRPLPKGWDNSHNNAAGLVTNNEGKSETSIPEEQGVATIVSPGQNSTQEEPKTA